MAKGRTIGGGGGLYKEEEEGGSTYDLRDLLHRKRQKKEAKSSGSQECVVIREPESRLIYRLRRYAGPKCTQQEGPEPPDYMMAQEEILEDVEKETQI